MGIGGVAKEEEEKVVSSSNPDMSRTQKKERESIRKDEKLTNEQSIKLSEKCNQLGSDVSDIPSFKKKIYYFFN